MSIIEKLNNFDFIKEVSENSLKKIEDNTHFYQFSGEEPLVFKGDQVAGVYLVQQGRLKVYNINNRSRETTLYWIEPGESCIFAMNSIFCNLLYPAWVNNDADQTDLAIISGNTYKELFFKEPAIQKFTFDTLSATIYDLFDILNNVMTLSMDKRIANFLLKKADNSLKVNLSHEAIASHLGTAREVVSRIMKDFEKKGLVSTGRGYTIILSTVSLCNLSVSDEE